MVKAKKSESDSSPKSDTNKSPKQTKEALTKKEVKNGGSAPKKVTKKVITKGTRSSTSAYLGKFFIAASVLAVVVSAGVYLWLGNWEDGPNIKKLTEYSVSELFDHGFKVLLGGGVTRDEEAAQEHKQGEHFQEKIELQDEKPESDEDEIETDYEPKKSFAEETEKTVEDALFEPDLESPQEHESEKDLEKQAEESRETVEAYANDQQNESQDDAEKFQKSETDEFEGKVKFEEITSEFETEDEPKEEILTEDLEQQLRKEQKHIDEAQIENSEKTETDFKFPTDESVSSEPLKKTFEEKLAQDEEIINKIGDISASEYYKTIGDTGKDDYKDTVSINNVLHKRHKSLEGKEEDEIETPFEYYDDDEYEEELVKDDVHAGESQDEQIKTDVDSEKRNESESDKVSETEPELGKTSESSDQPVERLEIEKESEPESATKSEKQILGDDEFEEAKPLEDETEVKFEDKDETETNNKLDVQSDNETETDDKSDVNETESIYESDVDMEVEDKGLEEDGEQEHDDVVSEETKDSKTKRDVDEEKLKVEEEKVNYQYDEDVFYTNEEDSQIVIENVEEEFGEVQGDQSEAEELETVQVKDSEDVEVLEETYLDLDQMGSDGKESLEGEYKDKENIESLEEGKSFEESLESLENKTPNEEDNDETEQEVQEEEPITFEDDEVSQVKDEEFVQLQQPEDKQRSEDSKNQENLGQVDEILGQSHNDGIKNESELYDDEKIAEEIDQKIDEALEEMDKQISKNARAAVNHYHVKLLENIKDNFAALGKARALTAVWKGEGLTTILEDAQDTYFLLLGQPPLSRRFSYLATSELIKLLEAKKVTEQEGLIREALQTLIDMYPDHVDEFNDLALTSLKEGRFTTAKVAFQLVLDRYPFDSFARLYLGSLLKIVDRDFLTAVDLMLPVIEGGKANIGDVRIFLELGDALNRLSRKEEAKHVYNKAVDSGLLQSPWQHNIVTVPGLSNRVWWTKEQLSEQNQGLLTELENYWFNIREELEKVLADEGLGALLIQVDDVDHLESGGVEKLPLFVDGVKNHQTCDYLPSTCRMIENIPDVVKCTQCQAQIYIIQPNTVLSSFISPSNARIRADLGLSLARDDLILVRGERRSWQLGRFLLYDPSFDREWVIGGDEDEDEELTNNIRSVSLPGNRRALLSLELWHPELSDEQKQFLKDS